MYTICNRLQSLEKALPTDTDVSSPSVYPKLSLIWSGLLSFPEMTLRQNDANVALEGTCTWIRTVPVYEDWLLRDTSILWLKGSPGAGKSTMMASQLLEHRQMQSATNIVLSFFFHGRGTTLQRSSAGLLRALICQLLQNIPLSALEQCIRVLESKVEVDGVESIEWSLKELEGIFRELAYAISKSAQLTIFVDALDESGEEMQKIKDYLQNLYSEAHKRKLKVRMIISMRLFPATLSKIGSEIIIDEETAEDIESFVNHEFEQKTDGFTAKEQQKMEDLINTNCEGNFLWARIVVERAISLDREGESFSHIWKELSAVPKSLDAMFGQILVRLGKDYSQRFRSLRLLQWIDAAMRPFSVSELKYGLWLSDPDHFDNENSNERMERLVATLTGGLVEVVRRGDSPTFQFYHQSVKDYITATNIPEKLGIPSDQRFEFDQDFPQSIGHRNILLACLKYFREYKEHGSEGGSGPLFSTYARKGWEFHAARAERAKQCPSDLILQTWRSSPAMRMTRSSEAQLVPPTIGDVDLLHVAVLNGLSGIVAPILRDQPELADCRGWQGYQALHFACDPYEYNATVLSAVLEVNTDLHFQTDFGMTPFALAIRASNLDALKALIQRGISPNTPITDECGREKLPIHYALTGDMGNTKEFVSTFEILLDAGADVEALDCCSGTPLQACAALGLDNIIELLISKGADIDHYLSPSDTITGRTISALQVAAYNLQIGSVKTLLKHGAHVQQDLGRLGHVLQSAVTGQYFCDPPKSQEEQEELRISIIDLLTQHGAQLNACGGRFGFALQAAVMAEHPSTISHLLKLGADVNQQGGLYGTALQGAAHVGNVDIAVMLIEVGADVNASGGYHGSALLAAARMEGRGSAGKSAGQRDVFRLLMENGVSNERWSELVRVVGGDRHHDKYRFLRERIRASSPRVPFDLPWLWEGIDSKYDA